MKFYYETVIIWEGELYAHTSPTRIEAIEWANQYPIKGMNCAPRVWKLRNPGA